MTSEETCSQREERRNGWVCVCVGGREQSRRERRGKREEGKDRGEGKGEGRKEEERGVQRK